jgi:hypothetical protein
MRGLSPLRLGLRCFFAYRFIKLMKSILVSCVRRVSRELGKAILLPAVLAFGSAPGPAMGSTIAPPVVSILTTDVLTAGYIGVPRFTWKGVDGALQFEAAVTRNESSPVDVYFGILTPGGRVFSWKPGTTNAPILAEGFFPAAQNTTATEMWSTVLLGGSPQHLFGSDHPLGLYSVFFFLVRTGADPRDPRQWHGATMAPLVITN